MNQVNYRCPCCQRPLEKMLDYPTVLVLKVEILPVPEVMDYFSQEAARARLTRSQLSGGKLSNEHLDLWGINRTPEVASAYDSEVVQDYFRMLENCQGQEVDPNKLTPQLEPDKYFKGTYPIPGTQLYISLREAELQAGCRTCRVVLLGKGPNLGSAGGPTLQEFGAVAVMYYHGRLLGPGVASLAQYDKYTSGELLEKAQEALAFGDLAQASANGWGAAAQVVKAIAEGQGWGHSSHRELFQVLNRLVEETGNSQLARLFYVAHSLYVNSNENWLPAGMVQSGLENVREFVDELEQLLSQPK